MQKRKSTRATTATKSYYFLVLVEVVFVLDGQIQILKRQIFEKGDTQKFPAGRIHQLNNVAAFQIKQSLPPNAKLDSYRAIDAFVLNVIPLGLMSEREFWAGMTPPTSDASVAAPATLLADTPAEAVAEVDSGEVATASDPQ